MSAVVYFGEVSRSSERDRDFSGGDLSRPRPLEPERFRERLLSLLRCWLREREERLFPRFSEALLGLSFWERLRSLDLPMALGRKAGGLGRSPSPLALHTSYVTNY